LVEELGGGLLAKDLERVSRVKPALGLIAQLQPFVPQQEK